MIKIETKLKGNDFDIKYDIKDANLLEHIDLMMYIYGKIVDNMPDFTKEEMFNLISQFDELIRKDK